MNEYDFEIRLYADEGRDMVHKEVVTVRVKGIGGMPEDARDEADDKACEIANNLIDDGQYKADEYTVTLIDAC